MIDPLASHGRFAPAPQGAGAFFCQVGVGCRQPPAGPGTAGAQLSTGAFKFVETLTLLKVNHEVAPKEQAYGKDNGREDCHFSGQIEWTAMGWSQDPATGGMQTLP